MKHRTDNGQTFDAGHQKRENMRAVVQQVEKPIGGCEMVAYVLILVLASPYDRQQLTMTTAEFAGQKACERAAYDMQESLGREYSVTATCLPKSLK